MTRPARVLMVWLVMLVVLSGSPARGAAPSVAAPFGGTYRPPVAGPLTVLRPFRPPPTPYAAGHRGVDLAAAGPLVLAAGPGVVAFAGVVVDRGVVVIAHPDGVLTEYEPVTASVARGSAVAAGQPIGTVSGLHPGCAVQCLHWGARRHGVYLDPMALLRPLGVVRLLPDG